LGFWTILANLFHQQSCLNDVETRRQNLTKKIFTAAYYHDVELNAVAKDASSTCAPAVTLSSSSKAVCQHTDVCIRQLSYSGVKLLSLLVQDYDPQLGPC